MIRMLRLPIQSGNSTYPVTPFIFHWPKLALKQVEKVKSLAVTEKRPLRISMENKVSEGLSSGTLVRSGFYSLASSLFLEESCFSAQKSQSRHGRAMFLK